MLKRILLIASLAIGLMINSSGQTRRTTVASRRVSAKAFAYFEEVKDQSLADYLKCIRPKRLSPAHRAQVIAFLPKEGEVQPSAKGWAKLAALEPIFSYHDRSGAIEIRVIAVGHAFVGLHARSVLLVSEEALDLLTTEELQAAAAHEMGHDYFWNEYQLAREYKRYEEMQELELRCDGVAIIAMTSLGR